MTSVRINALTEATTLDNTDWLVAEVGDSEARKVSVSTARGDPVFDSFGAPNTAFEFETSSLSGLTAVPTTTPDFENADTSVPGCYFVQDNATTDAYCGRYFASPATPFTAICLVLDATHQVDFNLGGIFVGESTPGKMVNWGVVNASRGVQYNAYNTPTSAGTSSGVVGGTSAYRPPYYLAMKVNSTTSIDMFYSYTGRVWKTDFTGINPAFTIGSVGLGMAAENGGTLAMAWDFIRVWNSALTFTGA